MNVTRIFLAGFFALFSLQATAEIVIGVFPRRPAPLTIHMFTPLADYLSKHLHERCTLVVPKDFTTFWRQLQEKRFDLVHYNQYHYIRSHKELGYKVILSNEEFGQRSLSGSLSVLRDGNIRRIADLRGKVIVFGGGPTAMAGFIAPVAILKRAGLHPYRDYTLRFAKNPPGAVIKLFNRAASAAGAGTVILQSNVVTKMVDITKITVLAESESFVHLPWAVKDDMPSSKQTRVKQIMLNMRNSANGLDILRSIRVTGFYAVADKDFRQVRLLTKYALDEDY